MARQRSRLWIYRSLISASAGKALKMRILRFAIYYFKVRIGAYLGTHPTHGPLDLKWRWETWHRLRKAERKYAGISTFANLRSDLTRIWKMLVS